MVLSSSDEQDLVDMALSCDIVTSPFSLGSSYGSFSVIYRKLLQVARCHRHEQHFDDTCSRREWTELVCCCIQGPDLCK